jgi:hypothetical protein
VALLPVLIQPSPRLFKNNLFGRSNHRRSLLLNGAHKNRVVYELFMTRLPTFYVQTTKVFLSEDRVVTNTLREFLILGRVNRWRSTQMLAQVRLRCSQARINR